MHTNLLERQRRIGGFTKNARHETRFPAGKYAAGEENWAAKLAVKLLIELAAEFGRFWINARMGGNIFYFRQRFLTIPWKNR